jgi:hypothetical protein
MYLFILLFVPYTNFRALQRALVVPSPCPCRAPAASPRDPSTRPRPVDSSATRRPARWV